MTQHKPLHLFGSDRPLVLFVSHLRRRRCCLVGRRRRDHRLMEPRPRGIGEFLPDYGIKTPAVLDWSSISASLPLGF